MKITCRNCDADQSQRWSEMSESGFALWHIECSECGQQALATVEETASAMGRKGGSAKTAAKKASSAANGRLGGRPKASKNKI